MSETPDRVAALIRRWRWAWLMRVWPWQVPSSVVKYVCLPRPLTDKEIARCHELARRFGWERDE